MDLSAELSAVLANRIPEITELARGVERFLQGFDVPAAIVFQLNLALDELLTNTISYGYRDDGMHPIDVRIAIGVATGAGTIETVIEDDAVEFDPFARGPVDTAAAIDDRNVGGLGIHLVKTLIEKVDYRRIGDRNRITLRQSFAAATALAERIQDE